MIHSIVDLSMPLDTTEGEAQRVVINRISHKEAPEYLLQGLEKLGYLAGIDEISQQDIPYGEFLANEVVELTTHCGTHLDAPYHFSSTCEGSPSKTIDEIPLEWCFGDGVVLNLTSKSEGTQISKDDIKKALSDISYHLKPFDIVLIKTGFDKYFGTSKYFDSHPGMSKEATEYICSFGIKIIGIDTYGFDLPFCKMVMKFSESRDKRYFWPAHSYGRDKEYCHIERLANLDKLQQPYGFRIACFPIKIKKASAAWVRVVAICDLK